MYPDPITKLNLYYTYPDTETRIIANELFGSSYTGYDVNQYNMDSNFESEYSPWEIIPFEPINPSELPGNVYSTVEVNFESGNRMFATTEIITFED